MRQQHLYRFSDSDSDENLEETKSKVQNNNSGLLSNSTITEINTK